MADWLFSVAPNEGLRFVNIGKFRLGLKNIGPKQGEKRNLPFFGSYKEKILWLYFLYCIVVGKEYWLSIGNI